MRVRRRPCTTLYPRTPYSLADSDETERTASPSLDEFNNVYASPTSCVTTTCRRRSIHASPPPPATPSQSHAHRPGEGVADDFRAETRACAPRPSAVSSNSAPRCVDDDLTNFRRRRRFERRRDGTETGPARWPHISVECFRSS
jgi:hypothetical protein